MTFASSRTSDLRVKAALPVGAEFGLENFAGDPVVQSFSKWAMKKLGVEAEIFVSWACSPDVSILSASNQNILIRSERLDTLLVEYLNLRQCFICETHPLNAVSDLILPSAVLRWAAEFMISYRWPQAALFATIRSHEQDVIHQPSPFRDETLATIDDVQRAALQCFCLAHELGHLISVPRSEVTLETHVDGRRISEHILHDLVEAGVERHSATMLEFARLNVDAAALIREIDADFVALELVAVFLANTFNISIGAAVKAALSAFEAQCFIYATKHTCWLLKRAALSQEHGANFTTDDWVSSTQVSVRARCLLRRAGFLLARWCAEDGGKTAETINRFVPLVDEMFLESHNFRMKLSTVAQEEFRKLRDAVPALLSDQSQRFFQSLIEQAKTNHDIRYDLFLILVAIGFPGGTDPIRWLNYLFEQQLQSLS